MKVENIKADWKTFERRATWGVVSSRELSQVMGCSMQSISNWKMRGLLPEPVHFKNLHSARNFYRISTIRAWLENKTEDEIHWEWARQWMPDHIDNIKTLGEVEYLVNTIPDLFGVEKSLIPADFNG